MSTAAPTLTDQQRAALAARDRSVSLAAGAGCGKTFVLTERFIAHIDPTTVDAAALDELVAITFTDAAAREMRDRIRRRCYERLQSAATAAEAAAWQRLMRSMDAARISTIHSFCTQLLRTHAVEAGLDPRFEVLDAAAAQLLKLEVVDDRLRTLLMDADADVLDLAAKRTLERLRTEVAALAGPRHAEAIRRWRNATVDELLATWREFFHTDVEPAALDDILHSRELADMRRRADASLVCTDKLRTHLGNLSAFLQASDGLQASGGLRASGGRKPPENGARESGGSRPPLAALNELRSLAMVQGVCTKKDWDDVAAYDRYRDACKSLRDLIDASILLKPFDEAAAREAAQQGLQLVRLVADATAALEVAKQHRHQLEFDDLLARAHELLTDPRHAEIQRNVAAAMSLVMVDEFQDTNPLQMAIIQAICGGQWQNRGLFAVGDFKQSIYRFNGAEPQVSTDLRAALPAASRLSLTTNFRSQPAITDFVNAVFHDAFDDYEPLVPARPQSTATPAVEFLWTSEAASGGREPPENDAGEPGGFRPPLALSVEKRRSGRRAGARRDARAEEARWIARRLAELLASPDPLVVADVAGVPQPRRLQPGDVAILLRTLSDAQVYEEALRGAGLEYYLAGGHAFYSQQEVYDILNLLRAVASMVDDIALAGALRSPLFALADETLFWLVEQHGSLNAALTSPRIHPQITKEETAKVRRAAATLARLRDEKDRLLVADLLHLAIELTGYDAVLLTEFLGPRKAANLEKLVEQARTLDAATPGHLHGFITQLSEFVVRAPKEALAATQAEGNVIRIMTFHYAKGLEFPLVVLPDLDRQRHSGVAQAVLDVRLGPLVPVDRDDGERTTSTGLDLYRHIENIADLDERKRLLYVACTRAADYLILSSSLVDVEKPRQDWLQLVDERIALADGALRQPLPAGYGTPQVRVTTEAPSAAGTAGDGERGPDLSRLVVNTRELAKQRTGVVPVEAGAMPIDAAARRRFSFSRLTGRLAPLEELPLDDLVSFPPNDQAELLHRTGGREAGQSLGTLVHAVLERMDLRRPASAFELCGFLAPQFAPAEHASATAAARAMVERFLESPRAGELAAAELVRREVEFVLPWPPDEATSHGRYLHGYLDCLYRDAQGGWRLVDYKTNRVPASGVPHTAAAYELQMLVYSLACERALGVPLEECVLALLHPGLEHRFAWDAAARRRGVDRVSAAIEAFVAAEASGSR